MAYNIFDFSHFWSNLKTLLNNKVDKVSGMGLSQNSFTNADKTKLDGIDAGATKTVVDAALSSTSTNPVQNKSVQAPIARLVDAGSKNKLFSLQKLRNANTNGTWNGYIFTRNGLTFTIDPSENSITINGTASAATWFYLDNETANYNGYCFEGCPDGGSSSTFELQTETVNYHQYGGSPVYIDTNTPTRIQVVIRKNYVASNLTFKPMLCTAEDYEISTEFVPYAKSNYELTNENASQQSEINYVVNTGAKNLFDINATPIVNNTTSTLTGEKLSVTAGGRWAHYSVPVDLPTGNYTLSMIISDYSKQSEAPDTSMRMRLASATDGGSSIALQTITGNGTMSVPFTWSGGTLYIQFYPNYNATTYTNSFSAENVMIRRAEITDDTFVPYAKTNQELTQDVEPIPRLVDAGAKNLLDASLIALKRFNTSSSATWIGNDCTYNGITYSVNDDGTIAVSGTATGASFLVLANRAYLNSNVPRGRYAISGCPTGGGLSGATYRIYCLNPSTQASGYTDTGGGYVGDFYYDNSRDCNISIGVGAGCVIKSPIVFKPMLCTDEDYKISPEFVPYAPSNRELYEAVAPLQADSMKLVYRRLFGQYSGTASYRMVTTDFTAIDNANQCGMYLITIINWSTTPTASIYIAYYSGGTAGYNALTKIGGADAQVAIDTDRNITYTGTGKIQIYALK